MLKDLIFCIYLFLYIYMYIVCVCTGTRLVQEADRDPAVRQHAGEQLRKHEELLPIGDHSDPEVLPGAE